MDLKDFEYLIALAEEGSVSKAADRLFMAQSSLSAFLQQYESELGVRLFLRTSKGICPTRNGEVFIEHLRRLKAEFKQAKSELYDNEGMKGGRVVLGISSFRAKQILPRILRRFSGRYPDVRVEVVEAHSMKLEDLLLDGKLDVAVIALPATKLKNEAAQFTKDEIYLVAAKDHPLKARARRTEDARCLWIDIRDAARYPFILSNHDTILGKTSRELFQKAKVKVSAPYDTISAELAVSMAKAGLGLAFTYASCVNPDDQFELFRIGREGVFLNLGVALPTREYHSQAARAMEAVVREVYSAEQGCAPEREGGNRAT